MYNLLISAAAALIALLLITVIPWWGAVVAALATFIGCFLLISRLVAKKLEAIMGPAMKDIQAQRFEKGVRDLQSALRFAKWQIYVGSQINSAIGMVHFIKRDFSKAFPYLEKGFFKNWVTMGMLAVTYMKRNKRDLMRQTFEKAVLASPKESLLWSLYGYCLNECGETVKGCEVLAKGLSKLPGDENLKQNLDLLREGKKLKMKGYGEAWLQFHLESLGTIQKQQMAAMGGRRRTVRK